MPLLEGLDGVEKMSKSLGNYVGITETAKQIFGKIMSISDPLMYRYYELLSDVPLSQIEAWKKAAGKGEVNPRDLKAGLARTITADFWSEAGAEAAAEEFDRVHKHREVPADIDDHPIEISVKEAVSVGERAAAETRPESTESINYIGIVDLLCKIRAAPSRGDAKRLVQQGGISLDGIRIADIAYRLPIKLNAEHLLKVGKRKFYKIRLTA
jgi:tyrosyl-tRNA synthetase